MKCIHGVEGDGIVEVRRSNCYACQEEVAERARLWEQLHLANVDAANAAAEVNDLRAENERLEKENELLTEAGCELGKEIAQLRALLIKHRAKDG